MSLAVQDTKFVHALKAETVDHNLLDDWQLGENFNTAFVQAVEIGKEPTFLATLLR